MKCESCQSSGWKDGEICYSCGGHGIMHCCDGAREQPWSNDDYESNKTTGTKKKTTLFLF